MKHALQFCATGLSMAGLLTAQDAGTVVSAAGDIVPGKGLIEFFLEQHVDSTGRWVALVETDFPDNSADLAVITSEGESLAEGAEVPGYPNSEITVIHKVSRDEAGNVYVCLYYLPDGEFTAVPAVLKNFSLIVLSGGDPLVGVNQPWSPGTFVRDINSAIFNEDGDCLMVGAYDDPAVAGTFQRCVLEFDFSGNGNATLIALENTVPNGQTELIDYFHNHVDIHAYNNAGDKIWTCNLEGPGAVDDVTYLGQTPIAQEGTQSPVAGRLWDASLLPVVDLNESGSWVLMDDLDGGTLDDGLIVKDGAKYLQEGDPIAAIPGAEVLLLGSGAYIDEKGRVLHWRRLWKGGVLNSQDEFLMLDEQILCREGLSTVDGFVVDDIEESRNEFTMSDDGHFVLYQALLTGKTGHQLILLDRKVGSPYCSAELNSTGAFGVTCALGSDVVADNDVSLLATDLPAGQPGYFLASETQGDVFMPPGSQGRLCLGGVIARFSAQVQPADEDGLFHIDVDLNAIPFGPPQPVSPGETWNFQAWYRDNNPGQTSNFTLPVSVVFQ